MTDPVVSAANARDRSLRRVSAFSWALGVLATALTGAFSVVAAHAFKGHDGRKARSATTTTTAHTPPRAAHVAVPPPEHVPAIVGQAPLTPPPSAPSSSSSAPAPVPTPAPAPPPVSSGGS